MCDRDEERSADEWERRDTGGERGDLNLPLREPRPEGSGGRRVPPEPPDCPFTLSFFGLLRGGGTEIGFIGSTEDGGPARASAITLFMRSLFTATTRVASSWSADIFSSSMASANCPKLDDCIRDGRLKKKPQLPFHRLDHLPAALTTPYQAA